MLSGIGVREYYRQLGYSLEGAYMVKELVPHAEANLDSAHIAVASF
jgi:hypothetical protein